MSFPRLSRRVGVAHFHERGGRGIAVLQALEDWPTEGIFPFLRNGRDDLPVALDEKLREPALEVGFGGPGEFDAFHHRGGGSGRRRC